MDSFQWKVGSDLRIFKDSVFPLLFENIEGTIDVTLTAFHTPNPDCFPGDDDVDVVSKSFYAKLIDEVEEIPIYGKFEGYDEDFPDTIYTIEIIPDEYGVVDFPYNCERNGGLPVVIAQRSFAFLKHEYYQCGHPEGMGILQPDNKTLIIDYTLQDSLNPDIRHKKRFTGQKVF